jgi:hypothetical protein
MPCKRAVCEKNSRAIDASRPDRQSTTLPRRQIAHPLPFSKCRFDIAVALLRTPALEHTIRADIEQAPEFRTLLMSYQREGWPIRSSPQAQSRRRDRKPRRRSAKVRNSGSRRPLEAITLLTARNADEFGVPALTRRSVGASVARFNHGLSYNFRTGCTKWPSLPLRQGAVVRQTSVSALARRAPS